MIKKNVCMRLSPERNLQLGFKGDLMFKLDMEYTHLVQFWGVTN